VRTALLVTGGHDRAAVVPFADGVLLAVADGSGRADAADRVIRALVPGADFVMTLTRLDRELGDATWTTAVIAEVRGGRVRGASVGDSGAWPLLGSGEAHPVEFEAELRGTLLLASDGLFKYAGRADIARIGTGPDLKVAAAELIASVRLRSGGLQDDVAVVLCRA
jgi:hypothetical protein